jgi:hypothetical protein
VNTNSKAGDVIKVEGGVIIELIPIEAPVEDAPVIEEVMSEEVPVIAPVAPKGLDIEALDQQSVD